MENAVKAMIMAAGMLIGMMIISIGISLYSSLSGYVENAHKEIANKEIQQFNVQFSKYINYNESTGEIDFTLTIQDIVTAANIAYENNLKTDYYVAINMTGHPNLQNIINSKSVEILENGLGKQYKCRIEDIEIDTTTGRVCEVNFDEI